MSTTLDNDIIVRCEEVVSKYGMAYENTAQFSTDNQDVSLHTCFGPFQAGKTVNEDAVLGVKCNGTTTLKWVCALADGVGSSLLSQVGSRVATWVAIASLLECCDRTSHRKRADIAIAQALAAITTLGETLKQDVSELRYKPSYLPAPAYRHIVNRQTCFQTTLCLVWSDGRSIFLASVGDSGALHTYRGRNCKTLFFPEVSNPRVNAICPTLSDIGLDHWDKVKANQTTLAVFTDGVAKSLVEQHGDKFPKGFDLHEFCSRKHADNILTTMTETTSEEEADNMSLLVVSSL